VRRRRRLTVPERITAQGEVLVPLDEEAVRAAARELGRQGVEAVAICFLFSFLDASHEQRAAEIVREELPDVFLSVSSEVIPQYREYERFSTVALNAFVGPRVADYVRRFGEQVRALGVRTELHLMTSGSGVVTARGATERPVSLLMSGPVAGVVGGMWAGRESGFPSVITLDVGGTSADIGVVQGGKMRMKHLLDTSVGPYQAMIPMVDVDTIGAGGGSIAYVDAGGIFRSGPRSAGAVPGPASYRRGGTEPTSTDAAVNLGWFPPRDLLGGAMSLDRELARESFRAVADTLGMSIEEASIGALQIAVQAMVHSIEEHSVRKGYDPRDFVLVAQGGAGPLFGAMVAADVGTPHVVVPRNPGVAAATGLLATDETYEYVSTVYERSTELRLDRMREQFAELEAQARAQLAADGLAEERMLLQRIVDCRYVGQGYELRVDAPAGEIDAAWIEELSQRFHAEHEREYQRSFPDSEVQFPNIRLRGVGLMPELRLPDVEQGDGDPAAALEGEGPALFLVDGGLREVTARYYARERLRGGDRIPGPAIISQYDSTTVVPPSTDAWVDRAGHIVIAVGVPVSTEPAPSAATTTR
jgi:5-oxoprolinase (ATP-hydrolysing)/N-methylhydantoinase A